MATALPPVRGVGFSFSTGLVSVADTDKLQAAPTLAAGDVVILKDLVLDGNIDTLPVAVTSATKVLNVTLSAAEMTADIVTVIFSDAAGDEWQDQVVTIYTTAQTLDAMDANIDSILTDTGTNGVVLADDAITLSKFDESTAFPLVASDAGATQVARVGADGDTMETLSDQIDLQATLAICTEVRLAELDAANLPADVDSILSETSEIGVAGAGLTALGDARLGNLDAAVSTRAATGADGDTLETLSDQIDGTALQTSVDDLEGRLTAVRAGYLDNLTNLDAAVSTRAATGADGDTLETLSDQIDGVSTLDAAGVRTAVGLAAANLDAQLGALPTDAENADAVWDEALAGHAVVGSAGAALSAAGAAGDPWITPLPGAYVAGTAGYLMGTNLDAQISTCCNLGAGAVTFVYTLTSSVDGTPIDEADVWVTSDIAGANILASGRTDLAGQVTFYLDVGTHYFFRQRDGWTFINPDVEIVS